MAQKKVILNLNLQKGSFVNPRGGFRGERDLQGEEEGGGKLQGEMKEEKQGGEGTAGRRGRDTDEHESRFNLAKVNCLLYV